VRDEDDGSKNKKKQNYISLQLFRKSRKKLHLLNNTSNCLHIQQQQKAAAAESRAEKGDFIYSM